ncbi:MAG: condensation domain-containing protein, partial [Bacillota bacterium]
GEIVQKIASHVAFEMETNRPTGETIEDIVQNFVRPFQLQEAPLFRAKLVETKKKRYLLVDMHHIISDGVSIQLLMTEFMELYQGNDLEPLRIQYKDFAHWQNRQLMLDTVKHQEAYWLHQFAGEIPVLNLPYD